MTGDPGCRAAFLLQEAQLFPLAEGGSAQAELSIFELGSDLREDEIGLLVDVDNFDPICHLTLMPSALWPLERPAE